VEARLASLFGPTTTPQGARLGGAQQAEDLRGRP
jgi:hypothetical protein